LPDDIIVDRIVVEKGQRKMTIFSKGHPVKTYSVSLGSEPTGAKKFEGDMRTPEGEYIIDSKNANSYFFRNLGISYPNSTDLKLAKSIGRSPGGDIKIHGMQSKYAFIGKFQRLSDWTNGCIALTNAEIEDLFNHVPIGTPITIKP
jgi:murein L,D-transpeptidase YafK